MLELAAFLIVVLLLVIVVMLEVMIRNIRLHTEAILRNMPSPVRSSYPKSPYVEYDDQKESVPE